MHYAPCIRVDELYAGSRDAYQPFMLVCIRPQDDVKKAVNTSLDKYLPIYKQVSCLFSRVRTLRPSFSISDLFIVQDLVSSKAWISDIWISPTWIW